MGPEDLEARLIRLEQVQNAAIGVDQDVLLDDGAERIHGDQRAANNGQLAGRRASCRGTWCRHTQT